MTSSILYFEGVGYLGAVLVLFLSFNSSRPVCSLFLKLFLTRNDLSTLLSRLGELIARKGAEAGVPYSIVEFLGLKLAWAPEFLLDMTAIILESNLLFSRSITLYFSFLTIPKFLSKCL